MMPASVQSDQKTANSEPLPQIQLVTFRIAENYFAVPVEQVWRVESLYDFPITRVPGAAPYVEGLINFRGRAITVIDLKKRLGISVDTPAGDLASPIDSDQEYPKAPYPPKARLLIVEMDIADQKDEKIAMIVDTVSDIGWFPAPNLHPSPLLKTGINSQFILGVLDADDSEEGRLRVVLELRQVLLASRIDLPESDPPASNETPPKG